MTDMSAVGGSAGNLSGMMMSSSSTNMVNNGGGAGAGGGMAENGGANASSDNLDMREMIYTPSQKDMTENKIHHMLTENMFMPKAKVRLLEELSS